MRRRALPAGLLALLVLAPAVSAFNLRGVEPPTVDDLHALLQDGRSLAGAHGRLQDVRGFAPDTGGALDGAPSLEGRQSQTATPKEPTLPGAPSVPSGPVPYALQAAQAVASQIPIDILLRLADRAQAAAHNARLPTLPDLSGGSEDPEAAPPAPASAVAVEGPSQLVLGATIIAVGAAAAATVAAFWMAGSSGSVGAAAATKGGSEMRRLLPFASPLFTRFGKDTVLGHPRREALYARILQEPGISLQALGEATGLSRTAVVHHLRLLEQQHLVVSRRVGRGRHYFENGGRYGHDQKEAYAVLQNERSRAVAEAIRARPGMMQKTLCAQLAIPPSIAHWHVTRLTQANLVQVVRQGRTVAYFPGAAMPALSLPALPKPEPAAAPLVAAMQVAPA